MAGRFKRDGARGRHFIREWRKHRQLTQDQLAERIGISKANLSRLENFKQDYTQGLLEALAQELRCDPADLLMRNPADPVTPWPIWNTLRPKQKKLALRLLETVREEEDAPV